MLARESSELGDVGSRLGDLQRSERGSVEGLTERLVVVRIGQLLEGAGVRAMVVVGEQECAVAERRRPSAGCGCLVPVARDARDETHERRCENRCQRGRAAAGRTCAGLRDDLGEATRGQVCDGEVGAVYRDSAARSRSARSSSNFHVTSGRDSAKLRKLQTGSA